MTRLIRQTGTGSATTAPDVVVARVAVEHRADNVADAFAGAGAAAQRVVAAVTAAGIAATDIATTDVGLSPVETGPWEARRLEGYAASEALQITVRDIDAAAEVLSAVADAAGNNARIDSVSFTVSDPGAALAAARERAFAAAQHSAQQLAELSGAQLGTVLSIVDAHSGGPGPHVMLAARAPVEAAAPAMSAGERSIQVSLTVEWELRDS